MKYSIGWKSLIVPVVAGALAWWLTANPAVGVAAFALFLMVPLVQIWIPYAQDNPENLWFKRKIYGWGWTPVTWQGWLATAVYVALIILFGLTIDENSHTREVVFTFLLPATLLTITFVRVLYKKGERPKWQWGRGKDEL